MDRDAPLPLPWRATHLLISPEMNAPLLWPVTHFGERQHRTHPTKEICLSSHGLGLSSSSFLCCPEAQLGNIWCCRRCAEGVISSHLQHRKGNSEQHLLTAGKREEKLCSQEAGFGGVSTNITSPPSLFCVLHCKPEDDSWLHLER